MDTSAKILYTVHASLRRGKRRGNGQEVFRERRATHEEPVHVCARRQLRCRGGLHRAAVHDAHGLGGLGAQLLGQVRANCSVHLLGLGGGR